jgi:LemA protein
MNLPAHLVLSEPLLAEIGGGAILMILAVCVLVPGIWLVAMYNQLVKLLQHIRDSWAGIDVELKRRYDLIPNLIETVKGYASHERQTLERVVDLRNKAKANTGAIDSQAFDEQQLLLALRQVFVLSEAYPQLKADMNFRELQKELAITEDRIAAARRFYNGNVRDMNTLCSSFPTNLVASMFGFRPETFFELTDDAERVVPRVQM